MLQVEHTGGKLSVASTCCWCGRDLRLRPPDSCRRFSAGCTAMGRNASRAPVVKLANNDTYIAASQPVIRHDLPHYTTTCSLLLSFPYETCGQCFCDVKLPRKDGTRKCAAKPSVYSPRDHACLNWLP